MDSSSHWLITGVGGFIGGALLERWKDNRPVIGLTRKKMQSDATLVRGEFHSFEDLRQLDQYEIAGVIHLAAVTGGCAEEDGLAVNVQGTRRLVRYLLDRGCRKFVLASSIAVTGCLDRDFLPLQLPIPDEHPCRARDAYGVSKALMEELVKYFHRVEPQADFTLLRFGAVVDNDWPPSPLRAGDAMHIPFAELARVYLDDVLRAVELAADSPRAGVRVYNVVAPDASCADAVPKVLSAHYGERIAQLDLSHYAQPGHAHDALYAMEKIKTDLGFVPQHSTRRST